MREGRTARRRRSGSMENAGRSTMTSTAPRRCSDSSFASDGTGRRRHAAAAADGGEEWQRRSCPSNGCRDAPSACEPPSMSKQRRRPETARAVAFRGRLPLARLYAYRGGSGTALLARRQRLKLRLVALPFRACVSGRSVEAAAAR